MSSSIYYYKRYVRDINELKCNGSCEGHHEGDDAKCYNCKQPWHFARSCPEPKASNSAEQKNDGSANISCYTCKGPNHIRNNCPDIGKRCYRYGKSGHLGRECLEKERRIKTEKEKRKNKLRRKFKKIRDKIANGSDN